MGLPNGRSILAKARKARGGPDRLYPSPTSGRANPSKTTAVLRDLADLKLPSYLVFDIASPLRTLMVDAEVRIRRHSIFGTPLSTTPAGAIETPDQMFLRQATSLIENTVTGFAMRSSWRFPVVCIVFDGKDTMVTKEEARQTRQKAEISSVYSLVKLENDLVLLPGGTGSASSSLKAEWTKRARAVRPDTTKWIDLLLDHLGSSQPIQPHPPRTSLTNTSDILCLRARPSPHPIPPHPANNNSDSPRTAWFDNQDPAVNAAQSLTWLIQAAQGHNQQQSRSLIILDAAAQAEADPRCATITRRLSHPNPPPTNSPPKRTANTFILTLDSDFLAFNSFANAVFLLQVGCHALRVCPIPTGHPASDKDNTDRFGVSFPAALGLKTQVGAGVAAAVAGGDFGKGLPGFGLRRLARHGLLTPLINNIGSDEDVDTSHTHQVFRSAAREELSPRMTNAQKDASITNVILGSNLFVRQNEGAISNNAKHPLYHHLPSLGNFAAQLQQRDPLNLAQIIQLSNIGNEIKTSCPVIPQGKTGRKWHAAPRLPTTARARADRPPQVLREAPIENAQANHFLRSGVSGKPLNVNTHSPTVIELQSQKAKDKEAAAAKRAVTHATPPSTPRKPTRSPKKSTPAKTTPSKKGKSSSPIKVAEKELVGGQRNQTFRQNFVIRSDVYTMQKAGLSISTNNQDRTCPGSVALGKFIPPVMTIIAVQAGIAINLANEIVQFLMALPRQPGESLSDHFQFGKTMDSHFGKTILCVLRELCADSRRVNQETARQPAITNGVAAFFARRQAVTGARPPPQLPSCYARQDLMKHAIEQVQMAVGGHIRDQPWQLASRLINEIVVAAQDRSSTPKALRRGSPAVFTSLRNFILGLIDPRQQPKPPDDNDDDDDLPTDEPESADAQPHLGSGPGAADQEDANADQPDLPTAPHLHDATNLFHLLLDSFKDGADPAPAIGSLCTVLRTSDTVARQLLGQLLKARRAVMNVLRQFGAALDPKLNKVHLLIPLGDLLRDLVNSVRPLQPALRPPHGPRIAVSPVRGVFMTGSAVTLSTQALLYVVTEHRRLPSSPAFSDLPDILDYQTNEITSLVCGPDGLPVVQAIKSRAPQQLGITILDSVRQLFQADHIVHQVAALQGLPSRAPSNEAGTGHSGIVSAAVAHLQHQIQSTGFIHHTAKGYSDPELAIQILLPGVRRHASTVFCGTLTISPGQISIPIAHLDEPKHYLQRDFVMTKETPLHLDEILHNKDLFNSPSHPTMIELFGTVPGWEGVANAPHFGRNRREWAIRTPMRVISNTQRKTQAGDVHEGGGSNGPGRYGSLPSRSLAKIPGLKEGIITEYNDPRSSPANLTNTLAIDTGQVASVAISRAVLVPTTTLKTAAQHNADLVGRGLRKTTTRPPPPPDPSQQSAQINKGKKRARTGSHPPNKDGLTNRPEAPLQQPNTDAAHSLVYRSLLIHERRSHRDDVPHGKRIRQQNPPHTSRSQSRSHLFVPASQQVARGQQNRYLQTAKMSQQFQTHYQASLRIADLYGPLRVHHKRRGDLALKKELAYFAASCLHQGSSDYHPLPLHDSLAGRGAMFTDDVVALVDYASDAREGESKEGGADRRFGYHNKQSRQLRPVSGYPNKHMNPHAFSRALIVQSGPVSDGKLAKGHKGTSRSRMYMHAIRWRANFFGLPLIWFTIDEHNTSQVCPIHHVVCEIRSDGSFAYTTVFDFAGQPIHRIKQCPVLFYLFHRDTDVGAFNIHPILPALAINGPGGHPYRTPAERDDDMRRFRFWDVWRL